MLYIYTYHPYPSIIWTFGNMTNVKHALHTSSTSVFLKTHGSASPNNSCSVAHLFVFIGKLCKFDPTVA